MDQKFVGEIVAAVTEAPRWAVDWVRQHRSLSAAISVAVGIFLAVYWVFWVPNPISGPDGVVIYVARGSSFRMALDSLDAKGSLRSRWAIRLAGKVLGHDRRVYPGKYRFPEGASNTFILQGLYFGTSRETENLTIPEGWRYTYIASRSSRILGADSSVFADLCADSAFIRSLGFDAPTLEGYLLPDTYAFHWQTPEREVVSRMAGAFRGFFVDSLDERRKSLGLTMSGMLALASIVEGESNLDDERARIAGVYWNRLRKRMRLEADPTVQYIIGDGPRRLTYADLRINSPYNTYRRYGLPPGPINNPGRASILATLYPEKHHYYFFVATGFGGHTFSRTYAEHLRAVRKFKRVRRMQQDSSDS